MREIIFDIEANSLYPDYIHCVSTIDVETQEVVSYTEEKDWIDFFSREDVVFIGHNIIRWDNVHIKRLLGVSPKECIDTLPLSWYLYPNRGSHGLGKWGEDLGVAKPEIETWEGLTIEQYVHRCEEDAKINLRLWLKQKALLNTLYEGKYQKLIKYLMFKIECIRDQEALGWHLDYTKASDNLDYFYTEFEKRLKVLREVMPEKVSYKTIKKPKITHKKDGELTVAMQRWLSYVGEDYSEDTKKIETTREPGNPKSPTQIKNWLYSLGWKPLTFKYERNKVTGKISKVEQVSNPMTKELCSSVEALMEVEPNLSLLRNFYVIKHRMEILTGFIDNVEDGKLKASMKGLTNTLRLKHHTLVNLPGYTGKGDWRDGDFIRGCLIADRGSILCGSDMSSLEDRTKQHYMYYYDPDYVQEMIKPGFDPHLDLAEFGYEVTNKEIGVSKEESDFYKSVKDPSKLNSEDYDKYQGIKAQRHLFKTVNYSAIYGVGAPTMVESSGLSLSQCENLLKAYWLKNWSVKRIAKYVITKEIEGQLWLYNPVSNLWYSLRYYKDIFSTLNQGTGVYVFDRWVYYLKNTFNYNIIGQFHDEVIARIPYTKWHMEKAKEDFKKAIHLVNKGINLNRDLDVDIQFGKSYSEIH